MFSTSITSSKANKVSEIVLLLLPSCRQSSPLALLTVGEASGILIGNFAKVVGIGPNKLFAWMRDHKILIASGSRRNVPMQEYMDRGYFTVKETAVNTNHGIQISFTTKITGRGQQWLTRKLLDNGMLKVTGEAA